MKKTTCPPPGRQFKRVTPVHVVALWRCHNEVEMLRLNQYFRSNHVGQHQLRKTHWEQNHLAEAVLGHPHKPAHKTPVAPRTELAGGKETVEKNQPREDESHTMHGLDVAGCPTKASLHYDVAAEDVNPPCMVMQHA